MNEMQETLPSMPHAEEENQMRGDTMMMRMKQKLEENEPPEQRRTGRSPEIAVIVEGSSPLLQKNHAAHLAIS